MSEQRPNKTMPTIVPEKDDLRRYHRDNDRPSRAASTRAARQGSSVGTVLIWLLLVATIGASGYLYHLTRQQAVLLEQSQMRISALENRLSATGEELGESAVAMQVKLTELSTKADKLWEQMDKLWASAWRRNQSEIKALDKKLANGEQASNKKIKQLSDELLKSETSLSLLKTELEVQQTTAEQLEESLSIFRNSSSDSLQRMNRLVKDWEGSQKSMQSLSRKVNLLEQQLRDAQTSIRNLRTAQTSSTNTVN